MYMLEIYLTVPPFAPEYFPDVEGFEWDKGNSDKNWDRHQVTRAEAEQVFLNRPLILAQDPAHSAQEPWRFALGRTDEDRHLMVVFTLRRACLRIISARPMSRRERKVYGEAEER